MAAAHPTRSPNLSLGFAKTGGGETRPHGGRARMYEHLALMHIAQVVSFLSRLQGQSIHAAGSDNVLVGRGYPCPFDVPITARVPALPSIAIARTERPQSAPKPRVRLRVWHTLGRVRTGEVGGML